MLTSGASSPGLRLQKPSGFNNQNGHVTWSEVDPNAFGEQVVNTLSAPARLPLGLPW